MTRLPRGQRNGRVAPSKLDAGRTKVGDGVVKSGTKATGYHGFTTIGMREGELAWQLESSGTWSSLDSSFLVIFRELHMSVNLSTTFRVAAIHEEH